MGISLNLLKRILYDARSEIPSFLILGLIGLIVIPMDFYSLLLSRRLIDKGFIVQNWETVRNVLIILIIIFLARSILNYVSTLYTSRLMLRVNRKFQEDLFLHIVRLPVRFFTKEPTGRIMSRLLDDATLFASILNLLFGKALINPLRIIVLFLFLLYMNINMCVLMLVSICLSILVIRFVGKRIWIISKEIQEKDSLLYSYVGQIFPNIELIKSKNSEKRAADIFTSKLEEIIFLSLKNLKLTLVSNPILQLLKYLAIGAVFFYGSWLTSKSMLTFGDLTVFLGASYIFFNDLNSMGTGYRALKENLARMEVLYNIIDTPVESNVIKSGEKNITKVEKIEFRQVFFGYKSTEPVIKGVSFEIKSNGVFGITGQSGSGKTTLARLMLRFYEPDSGEIMLDGQSIFQADLDSLRSSIGIVFQENLILNSTIKENISYGNEGISMESIIRASEISHAHNFIQMLPDQYETMVSEGGKSLSGGERQRLAIARAIITDPAVLILDEATSFLEIEQEKLILEKLKNIRKDKMTIIISHRLSAIQIADRIITLDNGRILETDFQSLADLMKGK